MGFIYVSYLTLNVDHFSFICVNQMGQGVGFSFEALVFCTFEKLNNDDFREIPVRN